jgi:hypothetical protein
MRWNNGGREPAANKRQQPTITGPVIARAIAESNWKTRQRDPRFALQDGGQGFAPPQRRFPAISLIRRFRIFETG